MSNIDEGINLGMTSVELEEQANVNIEEWGTEHKLEEPVEETNRTDFRRQRDRILYTGGFRRLQDKTQVMAATKNGDHRTRLTHSLEVEQIAISIADALQLNRDLVSAIALGHDVGHTPFGHAVEAFLDEKLKEKGGFSHAVQSVRYLSKKVSLSSEVIEGILKHDTDVYAGSYNSKQYNCDEYTPSKPGSLEAQTVYWADKLAYLTHDFEDFYNTNIYTEIKEHKEGLEEELKKILSNLMLEEEKKGLVLKDIKNFETRDLIRNVLRSLIDESIRNIKSLQQSEGEITPDLIKEETYKRIVIAEEELGINKCKKCENEKEVGKIKKKAYINGLMINFNDGYRDAYMDLRKMLDEYYVKSPQVQRSDAKAKKIAKVLYEEFTENPKTLPLNIQKKINEAGDNIERTVADYIANMTDRYAEEVFTNLNSIGNYYDY